ncbi:MAG: aminotransferase class III-fold pyridoxal phosphate-dependent enzyme [Alphaproteobacteria bacterium]|nr:aminotransferase class III-fold pyridoxal phosphate-dependent enzyme [Alphaproteobacteria bacterium]
MIPDVDEREFSDRSYDGSAELLQRAERTIPLGTQTFSKSKLNFPSGKAPLFLTHGRGAQVWDVDGNAYIDYINALLPTILGNCDPDVDAAIVDQLSRGISFSLATGLEAELAERLVRLIPCAEKVRFGKNGTDATSAAIRLSRAYTGRDRVAVCGYHGWQDWYIGSTSKHKGVPNVVRDLTSKFTYGDLEDLDRVLRKKPGEFAAIILEPVTFSEPPTGYLEGVVSLGHDHGAVVIFDEIITGFRLAMGGAQEYFSVKPDLATFGKSMANGMPISAVVGRADIMKEMEEVFYSGTFGGETLSIAAANATIDKIEHQKVLPHLWSYGDRLANGVSELINENNLGDILKLIGFAPWKQMTFTATNDVSALSIRTFMMRKLIDNGVLMNTTHNISYAHDDMSLALTLAAYRAALPHLAQAIHSSDFAAHLDCDPVRPVFSVRAN